MPFSMGGWELGVGKKNGWLLGFFGCCCSFRWDGDEEDSVMVLEMNVVA